MDPVSKYVLKTRKVVAYSNLKLVKLLRLSSSFCSNCVETIAKSKWRWQCVESKVYWIRGIFEHRSNRIRPHGHLPTVIKLSRGLPIKKLFSVLFTNSSGVFSYFCCCPSDACGKNFTVSFTRNTV